MASTGMKCDLCELKPITTIHYADDLVVVVDCVTCGCKMAVIRRHDAQPTDREVEHIARLKAHLAPHATWDDAMRSIPDHWHVHWR